MKVSELPAVTKAIEALIGIDALAANIEDGNCVLNVGKATLTVPSDAARTFVSSYRASVVQQLAALNVYEDPAPPQAPSHDEATTA